MMLGMSFFECENMRFEPGVEEDVEDCLLIGGDVFPLDFLDDEEELEVLGLSAIGHDEINEIINEQLGLFNTDLLVVPEDLIDEIDLPQISLNMDQKCYQMLTQNQLIRCVVDHKIAQEYETSPEEFLKLLLYLILGPIHKV